MNYYVGLTNALRTECLPWDSSTKGQKVELQGIINAEAGRMAYTLFTAGKPLLSLSFGQIMTSPNSPYDEALQYFAINAANAVKSAPGSDILALHEFTSTILPADTVAGKLFRSQFRTQ